MCELYLAAADAVVYLYLYHCGDRRGSHSAAGGPDSDICVCIRSGSLKEAEIAAGMPWCGFHSGFVLVHHPFVRQYL